MCRLTNSLFLFHFSESSVLFFYFWIYNVIYVFGSVELDNIRERGLNFPTETTENKGGDSTMFAMGKMMMPSQVFLWRFKVFISI